MAKVTLNDVTNLANTTSSQATINNNNDTIEAAFDNTLSRDGTSPNSMSADLDMNSQRILNLPAPTTAGEPLRKDDQFTSTEAQSYAADAETAKNAAQSTLATFQGIFLGGFASEPDSDPNGNPPNAGDIYYDTTNNILKAYNGTSWVTATNLFFPNVNANVTATTAELNNADESAAPGGGFLKGPTASTRPSLSFGTWRTPNANRATLVIITATAATDGTQNGQINFDLDEGGGTTQDWSRELVQLSASLSSGTSSLIGTSTFFVPAGGSYRVRNVLDPAGLNSFSNPVEFVL